MKKIKIFSAALMLTFSVGLFTSCSSSNDNVQDPMNQFNIVGKWKLVKAEVYTNGNLTGSTTIIPLNSSCPDYTEFKSDGTFSEIEKDANCVVTSTDGGTYSYNASNKLLTVQYAGSGSPESGPLYDITANSFNIDFSETYNGNTYKYKDFYVKMN